MIVTLIPSSLVINSFSYLFRLFVRTKKQESYFREVGGLVMSFCFQRVKLCFEDMSNATKF